jgi:hypothetical protein
VRGGEREKGQEPYIELVTEGFLQFIPPLPLATNSVTPLSSGCRFCVKHKTVTFLQCCDMIHSDNRQRVASQDTVREWPLLSR